MGKRSEQEIEREHMEDVAWVMSTPRGRRFVWWLLGETGLFESVFRSPSHLVMSAERLVYNGARREIGLELHSELRKICPADFDTMGLEARLQKALEKEPAKAPVREEDTE
jgi:hypothetical protein